MLLQKIFLHFVAYDPKVLNVHISFFRMRQSLLLPEEVPDVDKVGKFEDDK